MSVRITLGAISVEVREAHSGCPIGKQQQADTALARVHSGEVHPTQLRT